MNAPRLAVRYWARRRTAAKAAAHGFAAPALSCYLCATQAATESVCAKAERSVLLWSPGDRTLGEERLQPFPAFVGDVRRLLVFPHRHRERV